MKTTIDGVDYPLPSPHCDPRVLHAPGVCKYCDEPKQERWRKYRLAKKILFTGELPREGWTQCPAEKERGLDRLNRWPGNEPGDALHEESMRKSLAALEQSLEEFNSKEEPQDGSPP